MYTFFFIKIFKKNNLLRNMQLKMAVFIEKYKNEKKNSKNNYILFCNAYINHM